MRLYLIRHGRQCSRLCNVDVDLSEEGCRQAALVGERLFPAKIQAVYSSNLLRAVETARAANRYWNVEHFIRPELREISFGAMEGLSDGEIAVKYKDFKAQLSRMEEDLPYPGGECAADVIRRATPVFEEMAKSGYERIAVVTHGGVIRSMAAHYLNMPLNKWRMLGKDLENCSITELIWDENREAFFLERFNDYGHLEPYPELLREAWAKA
ncbi:MAG: histidine phosphatase family protein [Clostridium sp.]|nr:histidine phosphatase family protein [Clostridium sp.]